VGVARALEVGEPSRVADDEASASPSIYATMPASSFMRPNQNVTDVMVWVVMLEDARMRVGRMRIVQVNVSRFY
jgi:hypothetical protein